MHLVRIDLGTTAFVVEEAKMFYAGELHCQVLLAKHEHPAVGRCIVQCSIKRTNTPSVQWTFGSCLNGSLKMWSQTCDELVISSHIRSQAEDRRPVNLHERQRS